MVTKGFDHLFLKEPPRSMGPGPVRNRALGRDDESFHRGAMRIAPSRRMVSPFSIGFSTM
jgi:hypothetical protein